MAELEDPVIVSEAENVPLGIVKVRVVEDGFVIISAVAPLVPPVIVSPTENDPESPTVMVMAPIG